MQRNLPKTFGVLSSLTLFVLAIFALHQELKIHTIHDLLSAVRNIPARAAVLALLLTVLSYSVMTGYDFLAFRYLHRPIAWGRIAMASFVSYAFSNNMGFIMLGGAPLRYRIYTAWGLSAGEIARVVVFCTLSLWLGFLALGGIVFLTKAPGGPAETPLHFLPLHTLGIMFLAAVAGYLFMSASKKGPLRIGGWHFPVVPFSLSVFQILLSALDWALAAAVLYVLLPAGAALSYPSFVGIFMLAQVMGLASNIPGGLGVFETVLILLLSSRYQASELFGALLAFRGIYCLMPLLLSSLLMAGLEVFRTRAAAGKWLTAAGRWMAALSPSILALSTFLGGAVLLLSASTPVLQGRMALLRGFLPLPVMEISHFLGSLAGVGLILLARSLQRRVDAAYLLTLILLAAGAVFSVLKGLDYEEAAILSLLFVALLPARRRFHRRAFIIEERFTPEWIAIIALLLILTAWTGFFCYRHIDYSHDLWWRFAFFADAPRFLRAEVGTAAVLLFFLVAKLLRPRQPMPTPPGPGDLEKARIIALSSPRTSTWLALLGDKSLLFSESGKSFLMYGVQGRSWEALGDPHGAPNETEALAWRFRELSDRHDGHTIFYEAGEENLHAYADLGLSFIKLGEEGRVRLESFTLDGAGRKEMRHTLHKLDREGCSFEIAAPEAVPALLSRFKSISDAWLGEKNPREKGFSLGFFSADYLRLFPAAVVRKGSDIIAFANLWPGAGKEELSIDLMRYLPEAPHSVMEYLFVHLMLWGKQEGYHWFSLGMAPLSGLEEHPAAPLWNRLGAFVFRHGEHFYNFQGLRQYKEKFDPEWRPKYLAYPGVFSLPRVFADVASLVSGGLIGLVRK